MSEWQEVKLKEICKFKYGSNLPANFRIEGNYPVYGSSSVVSHHIDYYVKGPGIIVGRKGTVGKVQYSPTDFFPIDTTFYIEHNLNKVDLKFLYYRLQISGLDTMNSDAAVPGLNRIAAINQKIDLPPLPTQQKIAKILSNYDDLIENNLKRIKLLEESARLTYEEWFLRFRVDGKRLEINPESGLPFGWENKSVTECDTFKQDKRKVKEFEGEKKYYATANISETEIIADGEIISWDSKPSRAQIKPNNNTVWFARMSNTYKVLCFNKKNINLQDNSVLSSGFAGFKAKNDLCLPFLYFTINSTFFHELKDLYATGATQVSLNNDSMSFIKIIEPSANLAEEFGSRTLPLIEEISILRSKNQLLKEARNILLPRLMTNVIDTDELDIAV